MYSSASTVAFLTLAASASAATNHKTGSRRSAAPATAGDSARTVQYHAQDIVPIHAR